MALPLKPVSLVDAQSGMLTSVSDALHPNNVPLLMYNFIGDDSYGNKVGDLMGIPGYDNLGGDIVAGKPILGLWFLSTVTSTKNYYLVTVNDSTDTNSHTYFYDGTSLTEVGAVPLNWTKNRKMRYATFLDYVFAANGVDDVKSWNGDNTTSWGNTHLTSAPRGDLIINFIDQIYIGGNPSNPSVLYQSPLPNLATRLIGTWDTVNNAIPVNPDDNDKLTALTRNGSLMIIFKRFSMYSFTGSALQPDPLFDQGAVSQEVVRTIKGVTVFFGQVENRGALFAYKGDYPIEISKPVRKYIDAVDPADYDDLTSTEDDDNYFLHLGNITVDGEAITNAYIRYNIPTGSCTVGSFGHKMTMSSNYIDSQGRLWSLWGTTSGRVMKWNNANTFDGLPITSIYRSKHISYASRFQKKNVQAFGMVAERPQGAQVQVYLDESKEATPPTEKWSHGKLTCYALGVDFSTIQYEISVTRNNVPPPMIEGIEVMKSTYEDYAV